MEKLKNSEQILRKALTSANCFIENNPYMKFGAYTFHFVGLIILIATGYQIIVQLGDRTREIIIREAAHRHLLRESLFSPVPGSSGKGTALQELLLIEDATLSGLDLSCERVGGGWNSKNLTCKNPVVLWDVDFQKIYNESVAKAQEQQLASGVLEYGIGMDRLNFTGLETNSDFSYLSSERAILTAANFSGATLYQSDILGDFRKFNCEGCEISSSDLRGNFTAANFNYAVLNGTRFIGKISNASFDNAWAWADALPVAIKLEEDNNLLGIEKKYEIDTLEQKFLLEKITICDPKERIKADLVPWSSMIELNQKLELGFERDCIPISFNEALDRYKDDNSNIIEAFKK